MGKHGPIRYVLIKWRSNPYPDSEAWQGIKGKYDVLAPDDLKCYPLRHIQIIKWFWVKAYTERPSTKYGIEKKRALTWVKQNEDILARLLVLGKKCPYCRKMI